MQGIPWKYRDEDLSALFEDCAVAEEAKVVISKDGRSRVSPQMLAADACACRSRSMLTHGGSLL